MAVMDDLSTKLARLAEVATNDSATISEAMALNDRCRMDAEQLPAHDRPMVFARVLLHGANLLVARARNGRTYRDLDTAIRDLDAALGILKT